jgi:hypothetical protein
MPERGRGRAYNPACRRASFLFNNDNPACRRASFLFINGTR